MRSGNKTVTFATPPPASTDRFHPTYKEANAQWAVRKCAHQPIKGDGVRCMDTDTRAILFLINGKPTWVAVPSHWGRLDKDGWTHYTVNGKIERIPPNQRKWTLQKWVDTHGRGRAALHMLRRANGDYHMTLHELLAYAKQHGVILCPELKTANFVVNEVAARLVNSCKLLDVPCWTMALFNMAGCSGKCAAIIRAGGHFSPIFGKWRGRARGKSLIANWPVRPSQIWGPASTLAWLRSWRKPK